jgi:uncharacterized protein YndB with AHSA1/START domain
MSFPADRELSLTRLIPASPDKVYRCWTEPELLVQWFAPKPWTTKSAVLDVRPGGSSVITMQSPEGQEFPNPGTFLEVVPGKRLVMTDAFTQAWEPKVDPFCLIDLTFAPEAGGCRYTAKVRHWSVEACERHEKMGFHAGWGLATDQLAEVAKTL